MKFHCVTHGTFIYCSSGIGGRYRLMGESLRKEEAIEEEGMCGFSVAEQ